MRENLLSLEVNLSHFIDNKTWLVNVSSDQVQQLMRMDAVYALGERDIKDKVAPHIIKQGFSQKSTSSGIYELAIETFSQQELIALQEHLVVNNVVDNRESIQVLGERSLHIQIREENLQSLVNLNSISWIDDAPPENITTTQGAVALSRIDRARNQFSLDGEGVVLGLWDQGSPGEHIDFQDRIDFKNNRFFVIQHSAAMAGIMMGGGIGDFQARGVAPASLLHAYDFNFHNIEMRNASRDGKDITQKVVISNHSYGSNVTPSTLHLFGYYDAIAREWDSIVKDNNLLIVKASGNDRSSFDRDYDTITTFANAKNIVTVGSTTATGQMTTDSSWGPTDDGRIKPDLVANGQNVLSVSASDNEYAIFPGLRQQPQ